jgi:hypothetical protein
MRVDTAAGRDGLRYTPIIRLYETLPRILPRLFNAMFKYSANQVERKMLNCVVMPKQGKATYKDTNIDQSCCYLSWKSSRIPTSSTCYKSSRQTWGNYGYPDGRQEKLFSSGCSY